MKKLFSLTLVWSVLTGILLAAPSFPVLTDRVVDTAGILTSHEKTTLITKLKEHETNTSNQIVVVTLKDLGGYDIAEYGYQLGRHWGIGQKGKDNGVLLIMSENDRKVRIEVGYGLEGVLPDARAHTIIQNEILPRFKKQKFFEGLDQGVDAIIASIKNEYKPVDTYMDLFYNALILLVPFLVLMGVFVEIISRTRNEEDGVKNLLISSISSIAIGIGSWMIYHIIFVSFMLFIIVFLVTFFYDDGKLFDVSDIKDDLFGGSSGNGSYSGGGGSFGGGGASGSW